MIANFKFAKKFSTGLSKYTYENVFFDRFNSIFKGYYLVIPEQQLFDCIKQGVQPALIKIPSTECFGSQDVTLLEYAEPNDMTHDRQKAIFFLKHAIDTKNFTTVQEQ